MVKLVDAFFGKKEYFVGGVNARKAKGGQDIYLDDLGRFIFGHWQPKSEPKDTPFARARDPWPPALKDYVIYSRGLASAWRGRHLAMFQAWRKKIPLLETVNKLFAEEVRTSILKSERLSVKTKTKLWKTGFLYQKFKKPELQEAQTKIFFLYRSPEGRVNIGAALAQTTAISDRLNEGLEGIYGWLAVYAGQSAFLEMLQKRVDRVFGRIEHTLKAMQRHSFFTDQYVRDSQIKPFLTAVRILEAETGNLRHFRPYQQWAGMIHLDLRALFNAVELRKFAAGKHFLRTMLVSFEIKRQQRQMDKFLLQLEKGRILNRWKGVFDHWLESTILTFKWLQQEEEEAKFRRPVCEEFIDKLLEAKDVLKNSGRIASFLKPFKEAYSLL